MWTIKLHKTLQGGVEEARFINMICKRTANVPPVIRYAMLSSKSKYI